MWQVHRSILYSVLELKQKISDILLKIILAGFGFVNYIADI